jgi:hypothetical protein
LASESGSGQWLVANSFSSSNNATTLDTRLVSLGVGFVVVYFYMPWWNSGLRFAATTTTNASSSWQVK